tara:strand:+ start:16688 stop:17284 length:597 start_codon:yes stop_codon:yes gene_type:complete
MEMKDLLSKMEALQSEAHMPPAPMTPPMDKGNPVSMNVSLNASGKDHVEDLMDIVKNANISGDSEPSMPAGPMRMDIDKFRDIVDGPKDDMGKPDMDMEPKMGGCGEDVEEAEWDNSPDEEYKDTKYMTQDLAGGLNGPKPRKALRVKDPALEDIKARLWASLNEKKAKPDYIDIDKDGNKKEPMKKAVKDKEEKAKK